MRNTKPLIEKPLTVRPVWRYKDNINMDIEEIP
jgi:hypothetical protein